MSVIVDVMNAVTTPNRPNEQKYEPLLKFSTDSEKEMNIDEMPVIKDWLAKIKAYRAMYVSATMFYGFLTALIDIPLIIIPIMCSSFNMQSSQFGTLGYYILNGLIALIPILHGIQKYFAFNETLNVLKKARATFDGMAFEMQMFIVQMRHFKDDEIASYMEEIEQRIVQNTATEYVPWWIKKKFEPDNVVYKEISPK